MGKRDTSNGETLICSEEVTFGFVIEVAVIVTFLATLKLVGAVYVTEVGVALLREPKSTGVKVQVAPPLL